MEIKYERACTGEFSILHIEGVIRLKDELLLVGKFENPIESNYEDKYPITVLGVLQDVEDEEQFYMYETALVKNGDEDPVTNEIADFKTEDIGGKIKYFLNEDKVWPWIKICRNATGRYISSAGELHGCRVMIPSGETADYWDAPNECLGKILRDHEEYSGYKSMTYKDITDQVKKANL